MSALVKGESWGLGRGRPSRRLGRFWAVRTACAALWLVGAAVSVGSVLQAGESGRRVVVASGTMAVTTLLAARSARLGYIAAPQGLVVVALASTRVIPWQRIERVEASPHPWAAQGDVHGSYFAWVARIDYGPRRCAPLFTIRSRRAALRLAATLVAEVRSHR